CENDSTGARRAVPRPERGLAMPATVIPFPRPVPPNATGMSALSDPTFSSTSSPPTEGAQFAADSLPAESSRGRGLSALVLCLALRRRSSPQPQPGSSWQKRVRRWPLRGERGAVTAEYAIVILA